MGYTRKNNRISVSRTWRTVDMRKLAQFAMARVTARVFDEKKAVDGRSLTDHKPYSTKPIYIDKNARPVPRGGRATEKSMYFEGGYREYKAKRHGSSEVSFKGSGDLRRGIHLSRIENDGASIRMSNDSFEYGLFLNETRPWWGFSDEDRMHIRTRFREMMATAFRSKVKK